MPRPAKAQFDAVVNEALASHALANARLVEQVHAALFQNAGAHPVFDIVATAILDDHRVDAVEMQQVR